MLLKKLVLFTFLVSTTIGAYAQETLVFAFDLVRHGDRTPIFNIPSSTYTWPEGMGQLTARGMRQELQHGNDLRKKYVDQYHLLPAHYQNESMYVLSTNFDRTLMSAQSLLLGLYPLSTGPRLSTKQPALPVAFQPIPIHVPSSSDPFISDTDPQKFEQLVSQYVASQPEWIQKTKELQNKLPQWRQATGLSLTNPDDLVLLADTLHIYQIHRIPLPSGLSDDDVKDIIHTGLWEFTTTYQTKEIATLVGTPLLSTIADYLQNASQKKTPLKYVLFLAHDATILSVTTMLGVALNKQPPYVADLNFSLYKTDQGYDVVKVTYNDKPVAIPGCEPTHCSLEQFMKLAGHV